jgi:3-isopropylmalate/(R)-2-methylmalate dehydratase small subunit
MAGTMLARAAEGLRIGKSSQKGKGRVSMPQTPFHDFSSVVVPLRMDDVDTDQIIPARFLTATTREGFGKNLFAGLKVDAAGNSDPSFPLNDPRFQGAKVLLAHDNFGCGSSREHAVWALQGYGFKAVVAISFGDIFKNNCYKNGFLPIELPKDIVDQMHVDAGRNPQEEMTIKLEQQMVEWKGRAYPLDIDQFVKACLRDGVDEIGYILSHEKDINAFEERRLERQYELNIGAD